LQANLFEAFIALPAHQLPFALPKAIRRASVFLLEHQHLLEHNARRA